MREFRNISAHQASTFELGGEFEKILEPESVPDLFGLRQSLPASRFLGAGSNLVVSDRGVGGQTLRLNQEFASFLPVSLQVNKYLRSNKDSLDCSYLEELREKGLHFVANSSVLNSESEKLRLGESQEFLVFAGLGLPRLSQITARAGFSGLEFAAGIPASLGGAVFMNAGAHGAEVSDILKGVVILSDSSGLCFKERADLEFSYRSSNLGQNVLVIAALIGLEKNDRQAVRLERRRCLSYRKATQPLKLPSAGSVFKNPAGNSAGELIERAGFKGVRCGGVEVSKLHANWIVKVEDSASAQDFLELRERIRERVARELSFCLADEVLFWE